MPATLDPGQNSSGSVKALVEVQSLPFGFPVHPVTPRPVPEVDLPWWTTPAMWRAAFDALQAPAPATLPCFTHGDYQHFNVLWSRGRLTSRGGTCTD